MHLIKKYSNFLSLNFLTYRQSVTEKAFRFLIYLQNGFIINIIFMKICKKASWVVWNFLRLEQPTWQIFYTPIDIIFLRDNKE